jgi:hypothetical protein
MRAIKRQGLIFWVTPPPTPYALQGAVIFDFVKVILAISSIPVVLNDAEIAR